MYPTIVVVLVETRRSMADICEIVPSNASQIAGAAASDHEAHLAVEPINSVISDEAAAPPFRALERQDVQERGLDPEKVTLK